MNYADIRPIDVANGPGIRVSVFVSGCTHACPECFNPEAWDFEYGNPFTQESADTVLEALGKIALSKPNDAIVQSAYICYETQKMPIILELFAKNPDKKSGPRIPEGKSISGKQRILIMFGIRSERAVFRHEYAGALLPERSFRLTSCRIENIPLPSDMMEFRSP